jgi:ABC-type lipoprotein export system ATPase subunit
MIRGHIKITSPKKTLIELSEFELKENKINVIFGESGIGKSLVHKALVALLQNTKLTLETDIIFPKNTFYIFQEPSSHLNTALSLSRQLNEGKIAKSKRIKRLFETLFPNHSFQSFLAKKPEKDFPSGGEKQRVLVLMGFLAYEKYIESEDSSALFVFDEATAHLDDKARNVVLDELLLLFNEKPSTISFITHDYSLVSYLKAKKNLHYTEFLREKNTVVQKTCDHKKILGDLNKLKTLRVSNAKNTVLSSSNSFVLYDRRFQLYRNGKKEDLNLEKGTILYLKSPSGGGKTTLLSLLMALKEAADFKVYVNSELANKLRFEKKLWGKTISMVFQNADEVLQESASVFENFRIVNRNITRQSAEEEMNKLFSNSGLLDKKIRDLSGGQKQRVNILRSLLLNTDIILFDEPLKGMDYKSISRFLVVLQDLLDSDKALIMVSHSEDIFDRLIPKTSHYEIKSSFLYDDLQAK